MYLPKLIASTAIILTAATIFTSCERKEDLDNRNQYHRDGIPVTGAQIRPVASPSAGTGHMDVHYDKRDKVLNYWITWNNLSDSVIAIRVNGPAPIGYNSVNPAFNPQPAQFLNYATTPYISVQTVLGSAPRALYAGSGTYAGSILVDGTKVTEEALLNGSYFITLHTKTQLPVAPPASFLFRWLGEIRAQITFD